MRTIPDPLTRAEGDSSAILEDYQIYRNVVYSVICELLEGPVEKVWILHETFPFALKPVQRPVNALHRRNE
jgi:hypothetical protein